MAPRLLTHPRSKRLGYSRLRLLLLFGVRIPQHVAAAPDGLDIVCAAASQAQLLAQLADEHVDDLELRLVHAAIEMV